MHGYVVTIASSIRSTLVVAVSVAALGLFLVACADDGDDVGQEVPGRPAASTDYPSWIERVHPAPDAESSGTAEVQVRHTVVEADRQVRLVIDGVDVTAYATGTSPGLLSFEPGSTVTPVELDPGTHSARVELYTVTPGSGEGVDSFDPETHDRVDVFEWDFSIL